eukprot:12703212-Ditylum_brightwellii.AAC.1
MKEHLMLFKRKNKAGPELSVLKEPSGQQRGLKAARESKLKAANELSMVDKLTDKPEPKLRIPSGEPIKKQLKGKLKPKAVNEPRAVDELTEEPEPKLKV